MVIIVTVSYGVIVWCFILPGDRGVFGDMFGALTALFSGLAFAGIIFTILLQKEELELQRQELKLTRKEFELTRQEFIGQNVTLRKQRFENTFFNLLNYHTRIIEGLYYYDGHKHEGHDALRNFFDRVIGFSKTEYPRFQAVNNLTADINLIDRVYLERFLNLVCKHWFVSVRSNFYLYFQIITQLFKLIMESELLESDKERNYYAQIIRDQMSSYEKNYFYVLLPTS